MNPNLPSYISVMFILITLATLYFLYHAIKFTNPKVALVTLIIIGVWLFFTGVLSYQGFYLKVDIAPYRFLLAAPVALLSIIALFINKRSREFIKNMPIELLTYLSIIRVPVELVLWWLYIYGQIPRIMTFEGRNFDIIAGISAPFVAYFCFKKKEMEFKGSKMVEHSCCSTFNKYIYSCCAIPTNPFSTIWL